MEERLQKIPALKYLTIVAPTNKAGIGYCGKIAKEQIQTNDKNKVTEAVNIFEGEYGIKVTINGIDSISYPCRRISFVSKIV